MKVMFLVPSGTQRSHARFRSIPFAEAGRKQGIDAFCKAVPLGIRRRYSFFSRLPRVDVLVVHRELFSTYEMATLRRLCTTLVYDCSDAVWTLPDVEKSFGKGPLEAKLGRRFDRVCREADICVADNRAIADRIAQVNGEVRIVPTPVDTERYAPGNGGKLGGIPLVGWLGTPGNEAYLGPAMQELAPHGGSFQFSVVSSKPYEGPGRDFVFWSQWMAAAEPAKLQAMDIGVMPWTDDAFMRANCGIDILRYMAAGVTVVASDVGCHAEIIDHGIDGFLVRNPADWAQFVVRLAEDRDLRRQLAEAARLKAEEKFSLDRVAWQFWELFQG